MMRIKFMAFIVYPVTDMERARAFYEGVLGLEVGESWGDYWFEYEIGQGTLAITNQTPPHTQPGAKGAVMALEVQDLDEMIAHLRDHNIPLFHGPFDSSSCRGASILDPDGNEIIIHFKK